MAIIRLRNEDDDDIVYEFDSSSKPLGEGGMGRVFRGRRIDLAHNIKRDVAIKVMFTDLPEHVIERARREASIRVVNDNLLEMIDFVEVQEKNAYGQVLATHYHVVSEYLDGLNLDELLEGKTANHNGKPNALAERLYSEYNNNRKKFVGMVFRNILSGIMALHYSGFVHRDVDPSNIMVTSDGKIKLIDFGIARSLNALGQEKHLTSSGQFLGKPNYAAPELVTGDIAHQDYRTDIYSLGIMLFQFVVGHLPFDGPIHEVCDKQLHSKLPLNEVNDATVRKIIKKATEKKHENRYQTAAEFLVDIDKWILEKPHAISPSVLKFGAIAASAAIIISTGIVLASKAKVTPSSNIIKVVDNLSSTEQPTVALAMEKPSLEKAMALMMVGGTASEGLKMLSTLVDDDDYDATFLLSRLYFDPNASRRDSDFLFYDNDWETMRENCGLKKDNVEAHVLLMDAFAINSEDHVSLFALGSDFMANGERGCDRNLGYAKWCYMEAKAVIEDDSGIEIERYRTQIQACLERLSNSNAVKPTVDEEKNTHVDCNVKDMLSKELNGDELRVRNY